MCASLLRPPVLPACAPPSLTHAHTHTPTHAPRSAPSPCTHPRTSPHVTSPRGSRPQAGARISAEQNPGAGAAPLCGEQGRRGAAEASAQLQDHAVTAPLLWQVSRGRCRAGVRRRGDCRGREVAVCQRARRPLSFLSTQTLLQTHRDHTGGTHTYTSSHTRPHTHVRPTSPHTPSTPAQQSRSRGWL
jgi:hypothetical protein